MRPSCALAVTAILTLVASGASAQKPSQGAMGPGRRTELLYKDNTLSPEQRTKIDSIQAYYRSQRPSFTPGTPADSSMREKIRTLFQHEREDIRAVLTPDQQATFDRNVEAMRAQRPRGP